MAVRIFGAALLLTAITLTASITSAAEPNELHALRSGTARRSARHRLGEVAAQGHAHSAAQVR